MVSRGKSLNDKATFLHFVGKDLTAQMERIDPSEIDYTTPFGLDSSSIIEIMNLSNEGFETEFLQQLLPTRSPSSTSKSSPTIGSLKEVTMSGVFFFFKGVSGCISTKFSSAVSHALCWTAPFRFVVPYLCMVGVEATAACFISG